jgi:hypothetical protein
MNTALATKVSHVVVGRLADGSTVYYTGRAGLAFISPNAAEAFGGYSLDGARRMATTLNRGMAFHGVRFHAEREDGEFLDF